MFHPDKARNNSPDNLKNMQQKLLAHEISPLMYYPYNTNTLILRNRYSVRMKFYDQSKQCATARYPSIFV